MTQSQSVAEVISNIVDGASIRDNFLTFGYDRILMIRYNPLTTGDNDSEAGMISDALYGTGILPEIGDDDTEAYTTPTGQPATVMSRSVMPWQQDGSTCLKATVHYEGSTGKRLWTSRSYSNQEPWNFDKDGNLLLVNYTMPPTLTSYQKWVPKVPTVQKQTPRRSLRMITYVRGIGFVNSWNAKYTSTVNSVAWFDDDNGRQWFCNGVEFDTENNLLTRVTVDFLRVQLTWDQLSLYLDRNNNKLNLTDPIPSPADFPASTKTSGNGWLRSRIQGEVDFNDDFDPMTDLFFGES